MKADNSGPAFPCHSNPLPGKLTNAPQGMTLRQWYAGKALQGDWAAQSDENGFFPIDASDFTLEQRAGVFFRMADAMLAAEGDPSRLAIECGHLCREVMDMARAMQPDTNAESVAWNALVANCLSAGAVLPPDHSDNVTVCRGCNRFVYDCTCSKGAAEKPQKDPLLVGLMEALSETQGMEATRGYNHLSMAVEAYVQGRRNAQ